jgi:hypothetical protein
MTRNFDGRLSRLERSNRAPAVVRFVFGDDEPLPGNGPIIRISWGGERPPRWLTQDDSFEPEEFEAICAEVELRFGGTRSTGPRDPKILGLADAELVAIALGVPK